MADRDAFDDRRRAHEEAHFRKKEQELIERMRERAAAAAERADMAETSGVADDAVLQSLQDLGFTRETVTLLHLVPLIDVAWIDGGVTQRERDLIFEVAAARGVEDGGDAWRQLADWLERRPSADFFADSLRIVGVLARSGAEGPSADDLVGYCTRVAKASGGILGFGEKVSAAERDLIERIAAELQQGHADAAKQVVDDM
jgi:hypothetical protein